MKRTSLTFLSLIILAGTAFAAPKEPAEAKNKVSAVTLFRGSARVTRAVELPAETGNLELLVNGLPRGLSSASLSAVGPEGVTVRSVQFRTKMIAPKAPKNVEELRNQITEINQQLADLLQQQILLQQKENYITRMEGFLSTRVNEKAEKNKIDLEAITESTGFIFTQRTELTKQKIELDHKRKVLEKQRHEVEMKLRPALPQNTQRRGGMDREYQAVLYITKTKKGAATVELSYLVNGPTWSPAYIARLNDNGKSVALSYTAQVFQNTGESWANVDLTLSTASPGINSEIPALAPMFLSARQNGQAQWNDFAKTGRYRFLNSSKSISQNATQPEVNYILQQQTRQQAKADQWNKKSQPSGGQRAANWELNIVANESQVLELLAKKELIKGWQIEARKMEEGPAVTLSLPTAMTLDSQSGVQLVPIASANFKAESYYKAAPLLSPYVFRGARIVNKSDNLLLPGTYKAYIGNEFVGQGHLPRTAKGQPVHLGFGVDTQLLCKRELADKTERESWGDKIQIFEYKLAIQSFKDKPVALQLYGRIPATKDKELKIKLLKTSADLSKDTAYAEELFPKGILRWDVTVQPGQQGVKAKTVTYSYELKYDKDKNVAPAAQQKNREEFERQYDLMRRM